jgi:hypothetical protein
MTQSKSAAELATLPPGITPEMMKNLGTYNPPDPSTFLDWTPVQTGFAPYFEAVEGAAFAGIIKQADLRDPNFERLLFKATHDTICRQGAKPTGNKPDTRPAVIVRQGGNFTLGSFFALTEVMNALLVYQHENNVEVPVFLKFVNKLEKATEAGRHPWQFEIRIHPEHAKGVEKTKATLLGNESTGLPALLPAKTNGAAAS